MLSHHCIERGLNQSPPAGFPAEADQDGIAQCSRWKRQSSHDSRVESEEPTGSRNRPEHGDGADPGGVEPGRKCVGPGRTLHCNQIAGVERNLLNLGLESQSGSGQPARQIGPNHAITAGCITRPEYGPHWPAQVIAAGSEGTFVSLEVGSGLRW